MRCMEFSLDIGLLTVCQQNVLQVSYASAHLGEPWQFPCCIRIGIPVVDCHSRVGLDNDQLDTHLLYFTIRPLQSSTCFEHYILIIRRLNCIDAASGVVLSVSGRPVHRLREREPLFLNLCTGRPLTERTMPNPASIQFNPLMMSMKCSKHVEDCSRCIVK